MERKETIRGAYRMTGGNSFYDGMITCTTLSGKAVCRLVWDMNKAECDAYLEKALSGVPDDFSGKLLEVPVGTGTAKYIRRMEKCLAEKPHECEIETMVYAHGTHFVFPEGMLKTMLPVGSGLFVKLAFQAAKKYSKECRQTRIDIEKRMCRVLAEWKGVK
jgi:hypothetical protein